MPSTGEPETATLRATQHGAGTMIGVIEALLEGDQSMAVKFEKARDFWITFLNDHGTDDDESLAKAVGNAQPRHEWIFEGDRYLGKSTMPFTALGSLYDVGNGFDEHRDFAVRLVLAFMKSFVSLEVKAATKDAAALYDLTDDPRLHDLHRKW
jgi:hypothetical protein